MKNPELPTTLDWHYIKSVDDLPEKGKRCLLYVREYFGRHEESIDVGSLMGVGLTEAQRDAMEDCERKRLILNEDQHGNNLVNWRFNGNRMVYEGQNIIAWCYI